MRKAGNLLLGMAVLSLAVTGCASDDGKSASDERPEAPCTNSLCESYEAGYAVGEKALGESAEVTLSPAQRDRLPRYDGSRDSAFAADGAVADIFCERAADDYTDTDAVTTDIPEHEEAFTTGCTDGGAPFLSGKPNRFHYERPPAG
ncbi:hypothetical protein ABZ714_02140 [Streptomyces sp. NPDC006798]|uniref:hypothetical protein n=1 Tax=Streptomyces sp. NPDC006798 TaxID=3155462 RepID=UPI0033E37AE8